MERMGFYLQNSCVITAIALKASIDLLQLLLNIHEGAAASGYLCVNQEFFVISGDSVAPKMCLIFLPKLPRVHPLHPAM